MKKILKAIKIILLFIVSLILLATLYINFHPIFGGDPNLEMINKIKNSPNFDGEHFKNLIPTNKVSIGKGTQKRKIDRWALFKNFIFPPKGKNPQKPLITQKLALEKLKNGEFVWFGHSTVLFRTNNMNIMTDPVFNNAAPIPFAISPFEMTNRPQIKDLPNLDIVLISHDHYDHLDYYAIKEIQNKVKHFYVPLGVKAHFLSWGISETKVSEYDWYQEELIDKIKLVFTPSRHFSGRGIFNHNKTLWGSWVILAPKLKVYFSGDGGYSPEFAKIGKKFGGFDIAFIENGAYNVAWKDIHMLPEQSAQAGIDLKAKTVLPIHWGKFDLSTHVWKEPVTRISEALASYNQGAKEKINLVTPRIGEIFNLESLPQSKWWEENDEQ